MIQALVRVKDRSRVQWHRPFQAVPVTANFAVLTPRSCREAGNYVMLCLCRLTLAPAFLKLSVRHPAPWRSGRFQSCYRRKDIHGYGFRVGTVLLLGPPRDDRSVLIRFRKSVRRYFVSGPHVFLHLVKKPVA